MFSDNPVCSCRSRWFGMDTVCRTTMNRNALKEKLELTDQHVLHLNHPVGYSASGKRDRSDFLFKTAR